MSHRVQSFIVGCAKKIRLVSRSRLPAASRSFQSRLPNTGLASIDNQHKHPTILQTAASSSLTATHPIDMAANGLALPDGLHGLFASVNLQDVINAMRNITLADFNHLAEFAKGRELNADTISKLYEEARKLPGAGSTVMAAALVILFALKWNSAFVSSTESRGYQRNRVHLPAKAGSNA
jgi:hypothetical protein